jgi:hypothetical protein
MRSPGRDVDGVGLLRAGFMQHTALEGRHPRLFLETARSEEFVARMAEKLRYDERDPAVLDAPIVRARLWVGADTLSDATLRDQH